MVDKNLVEYITILDSILFEVNKIGVNYNQIAKKINQAHTAKVGQVLLREVNTSHMMILELLNYVKQLSIDLKEKTK